MGLATRQPLLQFVQRDLATRIHVPHPLGGEPPLRGALMPQADQVRGQLAAFPRWQPRQLLLQLEQRHNITVGNRSLAVKQQTSRLSRQIANGR